ALGSGHGRGAQRAQVHCRASRPRGRHMAEKPSRGLADVVAASTALSDIDGRAGRLSYRGYDIHQLAGADSGADSGSATFEEIAYLLQRGAPPSRDDLAGYREELTAGRAVGALAA